MSRRLDWSRTGPGRGGKAEVIAAEIQHGLSPSDTTGLSRDKMPSTPYKTCVPVPMDVAPGYKGTDPEKFREGWEKLMEMERISREKRRGRRRR